MSFKRYSIGIGEIELQVTIRRLPKHKGYRVRGTNRMIRTGEIINTTYRDFEDIIEAFDVYEKMLEVLVNKVKD